MKQWVGPEPDGLQQLLLTACLAPEDDAARAAWFEWRETCDFDHEAASSIELAALAVARLGASAGESSETSRCRGWNRRAWYVSELALEVAATVNDTAHRHGLTPVAVGDLATRLGGRRFAGRPFPVRSVEFEVSGGRRADLEALKSVAIPEAAARVVAAGQLPVVINRGSPTATRGAAGSFEIPDAGAHIAWLASRNWRQYPRGRLRWILEILATVHDDPGPAGVAARAAAAARSDGTAAVVRDACGAIAPIPGGDAAGLILAAIGTASFSPFSRVRRWAGR